MTLEPPLAQRCPRCGSDAEGAPWCPSCGLNLRRDRTDETAPPRSPLPPRDVRRGLPRSALVALIAGALALGGALVAIVVLASGSSSPTAQATTLVQTVIETTGDPVTNSAPVTNSGPVDLPPQVTAGEMYAVLLVYVNAYSREDAPTLGRLFASDLVRTNGSDPPEDRAAALATYQSQFDHLTNPRYELTGLRYVAGSGEGTASSPYVIRSDAGRAQGFIDFHFVARAGRLLIDAITVTPS